ncbi:MAG TPA: YncE family protein [Terriglobales bacterium]|nr:YncE family protein [Terriglobales bacterium]
MSKTATAVIVFIFLSGCGDTFRPVSNPIPQPGGDPSGTVENAIIVSANGANPGTGMHIDVSGDTVVAVENVGVNPVHAAIIGGEVVVANKTDGTLSIYPASSGPGASVQTVTLPTKNSNSPPEAQPGFVASTDNTNIYVTQPGRTPSSVGVVSLSTFSETFEISDASASISNPVAIAQLPNGGKIYVANQGSNKVTVIDPTLIPLTTQLNPSAAIKTTLALAVGAAPSAIVASAEGNCLYVANSGNNTVSVINATSDTVMPTPIPVGGGPSFLRFDPKLQRVYVANTTGGSISIINHAADCSASTATTVGVGTAPTSIAALSDGTRAYIANSGDSTVSVLLTSSNTIKTFPAPHNPVAIPVGGAPVSIGSSADGTRVVVANGGTANISIIRTSDDTVVANPAAIPAGASPRFVLMNP